VAGIAVIGAGTLVAGYGLVGAVVLAAEDDDAVRAAWDRLPEDVAVVVLTAAAARALGAMPATTGTPLAVVTPA
jgi:vacuolar-type H+-ATPase subunit F/Vma7